MTAKEYLSQGIVIQNKINSNLEQILVLWALATRVTSALTGMPRSGMTEGSSAMENAVCNIQLIIAEVEADSARLREKLAEIRKVIDQVENPDWRDVLTYKYLCLMPWKEIIRKVGKGRTTVMDWYRNGLHAVDGILLERENGHSA